jgi:hypothetical protein
VDGTQRRPRLIGAGKGGPIKGDPLIASQRTWPIGHRQQAMGGSGAVGLAQRRLTPYVRYPFPRDP